MKAVILANGAFPSHFETQLREAEFLAVCDGAIRHLDRLGIIPNVVIGDLDSIPPELRIKYADKLIQIADQESNDLTKAFNHCLTLGASEFVILGATGKREDHTLGNISLLCSYAKRCKSVVIKSDFGEFFVQKLPCVVKSFQGEQISIFCLDPCVKLTSKGLKYPLNSLALPLWANGTLNEACGDTFALESDREAEVIIYRAYEIKNTLSNNPFD